jgi:hypothetical protein
MRRSASGSRRPEPVVQISIVDVRFVPEPAIVSGEAVWENASHKFVLTIR